MGKKGGDKKKAAGGEGVEGEDPAVLLRNYQVFCKSIGVKVDPEVVAQITGANLEEATAPTALALNADLGPGGVRALVAALLGRAQGMAGPYKLITALRFWRCNAKCDGAAAVAELLKHGGDDIKIAFLQFLDNKIGPRGCKALGDALSFGNNVSLSTLQLDHNDTIGDDGVGALCAGLRSNNTLKKLSLQYCKLGPDSGMPLRTVLAYSGCALESLELRGNRIGHRGLKMLAGVFKRNTVLQKLDLADNDVGPDEDALKTFAASVAANCGALTYIDFESNNIGANGAQVLIDNGLAVKDNKKITAFLLDSTLDPKLFKQLVRGGGGGKKKGKKGKKGKKKKKK